MSRRNPAQSAEKEGTGIGLTIVKRLTELMGGSLAVESTVGQGTVFHLRFANVPVSGRLPVGDHAEPGGAVDFNDFAPATLLVVDDNQTNRAYMAGIFEKTHHQVLFANNGREALACLEKAKPDVVLLDIRMPVMDGRTTLAEIRKQASLVSLPVIAVTASSKAGEEMELQSQFSGYIRKPFSRQTLFLALAQFLQRASPGNGLEGQNLGQSPQGYCPSLRPTRPLSGRNSLSNCAARRQPNGRGCVTAWRLMRRGPLLTSFSPSARRRIALR